MPRAFNPRKRTDYLIILFFPDTIPPEKGMYVIASGCKFASTPLFCAFSSFLGSLKAVAFGCFKVLDIKFL